MLSNNGCNIPCLFFAITPPHFLPNLHIHPRAQATPLTTIRNEVVSTLDTALTAIDPTMLNCPVNPDATKQYRHPGTGGHIRTIRPIECIPPARG
jgi:hypothetical protein